MLTVDSKKRIEWSELWQEVEDYKYNFEENSKPPLMAANFNVHNALENRKHEL